MHFGCASGFLGLCHTFLDEVLSQDVAHIDDLPFMGDVQVTLGILSSCVIHRPFYFTRIIPPSKELSYGGFVFALKVLYFR
jgi:hypothetical protein